jgi:cytochrome c oxidase subunit II
MLAEILLDNTAGQSAAQTAAPSTEQPMQQAAEQVAEPAAQQASSAVAQVVDRIPVGNPVSTLTDGIKAFEPAINDAGWLQRIFFRANSEWAPAANTDHLFMAIWWFSVFWFVVLMALMVFYVIKYRRRPGVPAPVSPSHNTALEIAWTVVPSLFLIYLFFAGLQPYLDKLIAPADAIEIKVEGFMWDWDVKYPNGNGPSEFVRLGTTDVKVIYLPAGRPIKFRLWSRDVIHSWWIPDFRMKVDCIPNRYTSYWIEPQQVGAEHWVFCAEYCGDFHSEMAALIRVVPYAEWLEKIEGALDGEPWEIGQIVARQNGCFTCHSVDGSSGTGPTWLNAYGYPREFSNTHPLTQAAIDSDPVAWDNYARESIYVPGAKVVTGYANQMVPYAGVLSDQQVDYLIAYFRHLSDRAGTPAAADPAAEPAATDPAAADPTPADETDPNASVPSSPASDADQPASQPSPESTPPQSDSSGTSTSDQP